ncbi:Z1 domain-containing protein [Saccharopolyspora shandongensis]|uniref:Z1 domain-containing protein n=1 Tax=Saccharopolyspora shandongensis TaxID=418495 RepID=UPI00341BA18D
MDDFFDVFAAHAHRNGLEQAVLKFQTRFDVAEIEGFVQEFQRRAESVRVGYPPKILAAPGMKPWYPGPLENDPYWAPFEEFLERDGWPSGRRKTLDEASSKVIAYTNDPSEATFLTKGLVVGHVQSGKTTNYTAVIAKAADVGYRLIIVLSGIHNGLRRQTQERLDRQLLARKDDGWFPLTSADSDFEEQSSKAAAYLHQRGTGVTLCVLKKNHKRLQKLIDWLRPAVKSGSFADLPVLIVDDEADQASVDTPRINPQIRQLIDLFDKCTYLGYTATPFANVLIDPSAGDLYPETFILSLPQPEGYFGAEKIFGREAVEGEASGSDLDGHDMVRIVPNDTVDHLRPRGRADSHGFTPLITDELTAAVRYFWLATAARRCRGDNDHSTMLIHPSMQTAVHEAYRGPLERMRATVLDALNAQDPGILVELRQQWEDETRRVSAARFGNRFVPFDDLLDHLPGIVEKTRVVLDNYRSRDRLDYSGDEPVVAIAVGGNTLSRGLTLEGLVVSFFIRSARTYDTLLQMGRWFGFRQGYEDLPRIWMTQQLKEHFRHLATVEHEIRLDISRYEEQDISPSEVGVRIRTHPVLNVTAKMGRVRTAYASYGGRRVQTRYFRENDPSWLEQNLLAARALIGDALRNGAALHDHGNGEVLLRDVDVCHVLKFLRDYQMHEDSPDLEPRLISNYIEKENRRSPQSLLSWNIAVMGGPAQDPQHVVEFDAKVHVGTISRSKLNDSGGEKADIKTLMSKEHRVIDMDVPPAEARRKSEEGLVALRNDHLDFCDRGLLLIYPIAKDSPPDAANEQTRRQLEAAEHVIAAAFVFPGNSKDKVANRYVQVDISNEAIDPAEYADEASALDDDETDTV